ncbi:MAG: hypothetical protein AB1705_11385 [Verrucomicrobiota bacterium]
MNASPYFLNNSLAGNAGDGSAKSWKRWTVDSDWPMLYRVSDQPKVMKTNATRDQTTRVILVTLGVIGVCCFLMVNSRPAATEAGVAPVLVSSVPLGPLADAAPAPHSFFTSVPSATSATVAGSRMVRSKRIAPSGPVADARDATTRAVMVANEAAFNDYRVEPFLDSQKTATFDGNRWIWRQRVGFGKGDLEADVAIASDGTVQSVTVRFTTQQFARTFE